MYVTSKHFPHDFAGTCCGQLAWWSSWVSWPRKTAKGDVEWYLFIPQSFEFHPFHISYHVFQKGKFSSFWVVSFQRWKHHQTGWPNWSSRPLIWIGCKLEPVLFLNFHSSKGSCWDSLSADWHQSLGLFGMERRTSLKPDGFWIPFSFGDAGKNRKKIGGEIFTIFLSIHLASNT